MSIIRATFEYECAVPLDTSCMQCRDVWRHRKQQPLVTMTICDRDGTFMYSHKLDLLIFLLGATAQLSSGKNNEVKNICFALPHYWCWCTTTTPTFVSSCKNHATNSFDIPKLITSILNHTQVTILGNYCSKTIQINTDVTKFK